MSEPNAVHEPLMPPVPRIDPDRVPIFVGDELTPAELDLLYPYLSADLPEDAIEETRGSITKKGYDTTGYGYQYIVNRFNEVLGPSHILFSDVIVANGPGGFGVEVTTSMTIQIGNWKQGEFIPIAVRSCYGGHQAKLEGDARKGGFTNALKKTAGLFGVGRRAYEGSIDDDNRSPEGESGGTKRKPSGAGTSTGATTGTGTPARPPAAAAGPRPAQANSGAAGLGAPTKPGGTTAPAAQGPAPASPPAAQDAKAPPAAAAATPAASGVTAGSFQICKAPKVLESKEGERAGQKYAYLKGRDAQGAEFQLVGFGDLVGKLNGLKEGEALSGQFKQVNPVCFEVIGLQDAAH